MEVETNLWDGLPSKAKQYIYLKAGVEEDIHFQGSKR